MGVLFIASFHNLHGKSPWVACRCEVFWLEAWQIQSQFKGNINEYQFFLKSVLLHK